MNSLVFADANILVDAILDYDRRDTAHQLAQRRARQPETQLPMLDTLFSSKDPRLNDLAAAIDDGEFATSDNLLDTVGVALTKKRGLAKVLVSERLDELVSYPGITGEMSSRTWSDIRDEALTVTWPLLKRTVPTVLADMDAHGRRIDSSDPRVDLEDLGVCTTLARLAKSHPDVMVTFATCDGWCGVGASAMVANIRTRMYHHDGGRWNDHTYTTPAESVRTPPAHNPRHTPRHVTISTPVTTSHNRGYGR